MTSLASWGPTLVMVIAVSLAATVCLRLAKGARGVAIRPQLGSGKGLDTLSATLREAEAVNAYRTDLPHNPRVHLEPIVRIAPTRYRQGVAEIPRHFSKGHVVSVDLNLMSANQAARLVDFCSGYLVGSPGWMFRAAERVMVLTPTERNVTDAV